MALTSDQIKQQSKNAYKQWAELWRKNAEAHSKREMRDMSDFENVGIGRACVAVGNCYSLELEIETLKKHASNVDIICCDKTLGHLLDNGIKPTYCLVADAVVNADTYLKPWKDKLQDTIFFGNVCCNPVWAEIGNWKERYFFAVEDILGSEKEFMGISKCPNKIPAGTNVGNSLVVLLTRSDNGQRRNFFGYDKILLVGFDFSWRSDGKYYAFDDDAKGKGNYMRHIYARQINGQLCYTSNNLAFSAAWLQQYISAFRLPVILCSKDSVLAIKNVAALDEQMRYSFREDDSARARKMMAERRALIEKKRALEIELRSIGDAHWLQYIATAQ